MYNHVLHIIFRLGNRENYRKHWIRFSESTSHLPVV